MEPVSFLNPTPVPVQSNRVNKKEADKDSDTDQEAHVSKQMLSFVMDDPDFESEEFETSKKKVDVVYSVRWHNYCLTLVIMELSICYIMQFHTKMLRSDVFNFILSYRSIPFYKTIHLTYPMTALYPGQHWTFSNPLSFL